MIFAGCSSVDDSTATSVAQSDETWAVADTALVMGGSEAPGGPQFFMPRRARFGPGDSIGVMDGLVELRIHDPTGRFVRTVGGRGQGPGEFTAAYWWDWLSDGGFLVVDEQRSARLLDASGTETVRRALEPVPEFNVPLAALEGQRIVALTRFPLPASSGENVWVRREVDLFVADLTGGQPARVLDRVPGLGWWGASGRFLALPLGPRSTVAARGDVVAFSDGVEYSMTFYDLQGRKKKLALSREAERTEPRHLDAWVAEREALLREMGAPPAAKALALGDDPPLRATLPAWAGMLVDGSGCVWARWAPRPGRDRETWDVLDPAGLHLGVVEFPPRFELTDVGRDAALGIGADDLGIESVLALRLPSALTVRTCGAPFR